MLFNSTSFIFLFMPLVLLITSKLRGQNWVRAIALFSLIFYAFAGHAWFLIPMLFTTVLDFFLAKEMEKPKNGDARKSILVFSICANLSLLFYFKYAGLFTHLLGISIAGVILPAGISFYTFQTLSYMIDVYRGSARAERNFWVFLSFVSFFPHLVAGPLTRHHQLIPQLKRNAEIKVTPLWKAGVFLFVLGLSKKVLVADQIAHLIDPVLEQPNLMSNLDSWFALLGFAFQIYFDFSGYTDMAIGLGRLLGVELPQNFNDPYRSLNPSDFWKRWHITLSQWLRDYLYIPLGGNRCSPARQRFNLFMTMLLGGLWHGANFTFVIWGFYHGLLLVLYHQFQKKWDGLSPPSSKVFTFVLITFGWVFFRARNLHEVSIWFGQLFIPSHLASLLNPFDLIKLELLLIVAFVMTTKARSYSKIEAFEKSNVPFEFALGLLAALAFFMMATSSKFMYFQF